MRELNSANITDAVLEQMATTPDARMKEIQTAAVKHLHAFARETNLTPAEWIAGIGFMTNVGQMCTPERQEFILLSDTLGLSALVNFLHDKTAMEEATGTSLLGPFYRENAPVLAAGSQIARKVKPGSECSLYGRVTDVQGQPIANARVSLWQTSADGLYDIQESATEVDYRGVFTTDANGVYVARTVIPVGYTIPMDGPVGAMVRMQKRHGMRPAHIHFLVSSPGFRELVTALYLRSDPYLATDTVFGSSGDLAVDLVADDPNAPIQGMPAMRFDMALSRESAEGAGRVGADPSQILKPGPAATPASVATAVPVAAAVVPAAVAVARASVAPTPVPEKRGFLSGLFGRKT
jgi:hydroxyquinol 1,2-dioxygenase